MKTSAIQEQPSPLLLPKVNSGKAINFVKSDRVIEGKVLEKELNSTFGSDNFLNFRSKPPKRKRKKVLQNKVPLTERFED